MWESWTWIQKLACKHVVQATRTWRRVDGAEAASDLICTSGGLHSWSCL